ncbi:hypothetical protein ACHAPE_010385 [Trichoderma viride]
MSEHIPRAVSSVAITANGTATPEQLSMAAALIPLLTFPLLPPLHSHKVVFWSSFLNLVSYMFNFAPWAAGAPCIHLSYFTTCMTILSLMLGWGIVCEWKPYTEWKQGVVSWSGYVACSLSSFHFATLGGYFIAFDNLLVWKNTALLIAWLPVVFWLDRFALQTYPDVEPGGYTAVNNQSDSDDTPPIFTGVTVYDTDNDADDELGDSTDQEAREGGDAGARRRAEQDGGENHEEQYFGRSFVPYPGYESRFEQRFMPHHSQYFKRHFGPRFEQRSGREVVQRRQTGGITRKTVEERCTFWGIAAMGFVCASVPVLLGLQYIALN